MHYVLCNRRFVLGILYFSLCTSQCRQRKGLGAACLWERERATVGHHYAVCLLTSWVLHSERKQEKNQIKKRWKKKGHYGSPLLLSSCVMDWEKRMKTRFLLKPCDWIWKQKHDIYKFCKQNSLRITLGNKTNRKKPKKRGHHLRPLPILSIYSSTPCILHWEMYEKHFFEEQVIYIYFLKVFSNFKASGKGGKMRKYLTKSFVNENIMFIKSVTKSDRAQGTGTGTTW